MNEKGIIFFFNLKYSFYLALSYPTLFQYHKIVELAGTSGYLLVQPPCSKQSQLEQVLSCYSALQPVSPPVCTGAYLAALPRIPSSFNLIFTVK